MNSYTRRKLKGAGVEAETVPCKICGTPTPMTGTKLCNRCWEVDGRIDGMLRVPQARNWLLRKLLEAYEYDHK